MSLICRLYNTSKSNSPVRVGDWVVAAAALLASGLALRKRGEGEKTPE